MRKNLAAFTSTDVEYPAYVSINLVDHGFVEITLREKGKDGNCGQVVEVTLSGTEFKALIGELVLGGLA